MYVYHKMYLWIYVNYTGPTKVELGIYINSFYDISDVTMVRIYLT